MRWGKYGRCEGEAGGHRKRYHNGGEEEKGGGARQEAAGRRGLLTVKLGCQYYDREVCVYVG